MLILIRSITDVITNSSDVAYNLEYNNKYNNFFIRYLKSFEIDYYKYLNPVEIKTEEDLKNLVLSYDYCGWLWTESNHNNQEFYGEDISPKYDLCEDWELLEYMRNEDISKEDAWNFIKKAYINCIGRVCFSISNDGGYNDKVIDKVTKAYRLYYLMLFLIRQGYKEHDEVDAVLTRKVFKDEKSLDIIDISEKFKLKIKKNWVFSIKGSSSLSKEMQEDYNWSKYDLTINNKLF